ncbi:hypothetical protein KUTeg_011665 [Tegillarca granosa]|uniref:PPM-type phosphatase domain-containing protein n=1 Tax=Tegillarca granosa TaxID=220873 RepID=A0ABQ9EXA3_TEGGR|nr:hypothetical protein KUTeg_011665 [Tegillarca granosa]
MDSFDVSSKLDGKKIKVSWDLKKGNAAVYAIQGRRPHMEDRFNIVNDLEHTNTSIFGVFDGHGGEFAAEFTEKTLFKSLMIQLLKASLEENSLNLTELMTQEMLNVDNQLLGITRSNMDISERKRIKQAGGFISFNGVWRVAGVLATSRAIGDYPLKDKNLVTAEPDVFTFDLNELKPQFIILATDGLWDCFSNQEAVDYIKDRLHEPHFGAKSLVLQAYYRGSLDNISVLVVNLMSDTFTNVDGQ